VTKAEASKRAIKAVTKEKQTKSEEASLHSQPAGKAKVTLKPDALKKQSQPTKIVISSQTKQALPKQKEESKKLRKDLSEDSEKFAGAKRPAQQP
jgi:hypothetical protein